MTIITKVCFLPLAKLNMHFLSHCFTRGPKPSEEKRVIGDLRGTWWVWNLFFVVHSFFGQTRQWFYPSTAGTSRASRYTRTEGTSRACWSWGIWRPDRTSRPTWTQREWSQTCHPVVITAITGYRLISLCFCRDMKASWGSRANREEMDSKWVL